MASRLITDLAPRMQDMAHSFVKFAAANGLDVLIYCTHRSYEEQARLYRRGRSLKTIKQKAGELDRLYSRPDLADILIGVGAQHGRRVTNAAPGQSFHNYKLAFDGVPLREGKPVWGAKRQEDRDLWLQYGKAGKLAGLEWAGDWRRFKEYPHMQAPGLSWRDLIHEQAAATL